MEIFLKFLRIALPESSRLCAKSQDFGKLRILRVISVVTRGDVNNINESRRSFCVVIPQDFQQSRAPIEQDHSKSSVDVVVETLDRSIRGFGSAPAGRESFRITVT